MPVIQIKLPYRRPVSVLFAVLCYLVSAGVVPASHFASAAPASEAGWQLVNFWSEWCGPCRKEIPMLNALAVELAPFDIAVVGINYDDDHPAVTLEKQERMGIGFHTLTGSEREALNLRLPDAMPTTYIVSPDGNPVKALIGLQSREQLLNALIEQGLFPKNSL